MDMVMVGVALGRTAVQASRGHCPPRPLCQAIEFWGWREPAWELGLPFPLSSLTWTLEHL